MEDCTEERIFVTRDYGLFHKITWNREVNEDAHFKQIMNSLKTIGWVSAYPILVDDKYNILDGQHRFDAAKKLGIPIKYVVDNRGVNINQVQILNATTKKWGFTDHIKSLASAGNEDAIFMMKCLADFTPTLAPSDVIKICLQGSTQVGTNATLSPRIIEKMSNGHGVISQSRNDILYQLDYVSSLLPYSRGRRTIFVLLLIFAIRCENIDQNQLHARILKHPQKLKPFTNTEEALDSLETVYNFGSKAKVSFKTEYANMQAKGQKQRAVAKKMDELSEGSLMDHE